MTAPRLALTRAQILAYRRAVNELDRRLPLGAGSLRLAAWAGHQDSVPRAGLLSVHARVEGTGPDAWRDPALVQLWGPRFSVYVVPAQDHAVFSLGRLPDGGPTRRVAEDLAARLDAFLDGRRMTYWEAGQALGVHPNQLRYAALTGRLLIQWDGARQSTVWTVPPPTIEPLKARVELARRYLRVFGPTTAPAFARWAGMGRREAAAAFATLEPSLTPARTPIGDAWILASDEPAFAAVTAVAAPEGSDGADGAAAARLLPSGDAYWLVHGAARELLVPDRQQRDALWTPRIWPGAVLVRGELAGTWRRGGADLAIEPWRRLAPAERDAIVAEAESLPIPGLDRRITVRGLDQAP